MSRKIFSTINHSITTTLRLKLSAIKHPYFTPLQPIQKSNGRTSLLNEIRSSPSGLYQYPKRQKGRAPRSNAKTNSKMVPKPTTNVPTPLTHSTNPTHPIYKNAPTKPANPTITLPAPTSSLLALLPDCVGEAPVAVPLDELATLTSPLFAVVCAEVAPVPVVVAPVVTGVDTSLEIALDVEEV